MDRKIWMTALIALALGLGSGYLLFRNAPAEGTAQEAPGQSSASDEEQIWTCSMHPQIRREEPGLCPICEMDLIPLESTTSDDPLVLQMTDEAVKLAQVQTTVIGKERNREESVLRLSGKVEADERRAFSLSAHVPGRIEKLHLSFTGESVREGQKIADIYSPDLITAQQEFVEALRLESVIPELLKAARNKLRYWKIDEETIRNLEKSGRIRETFTLFAEASGLVNRRRVTVGDYVKQGAPLFDLIDLEKVWVLFDAYEADLPLIQTGRKIEFTTPAVPGKRFQARVTFIDPVIDPDTRTAAVRIELSNPGGLLKPEMLVSGLLSKQSSVGSQLTVPKSAVLWTGKRSVVYVQLPDRDIPSFQFREITLGESQGEYYTVLDGLAEGEEVVTHGNFAIDAAAQLNNQASMMNKDVNRSAEEKQATPDYRDQTPEAFKEQLAQMTDAYIQLKDAFVETRSEKASGAANEFLSALDQTNMNLLEEDAHLYWMEKRNALKAHGQKLSELTDIEAQRKQFEFLSSTLIETISAFGTSEDALFVQHCPMAFNDQGADWIAREEQIRNPYFGDKMLRCGIVKESLTEKKKQ